MRPVIDTLLYVSGGITGWFAEAGTPRFGVVQFGVATLIVTAIVFFVALWPFWLVKKIYRSYKRTAGGQNQKR